MLWRLPRAVGAASALGVVLAGCGSDERPARASLNAPADAYDAALDVGSGNGPPPADAPGFCGNQIVEVIEDRPNLYFVVDRSGSMLAPFGAYDRYTAARLAIRDVLKLVGHRVSYGAAVLPAWSNPDGCQPGSEIFATRQGDPQSSTSSGELGPVLLEFLGVLGRFQPDGGTPVSPTLRALSPTLQALEGDTYLVLATDGAPNCNPEASCGPDECELNLGGAVLGGRPCNDSFNCCDPLRVEDGQLSCVDTDESERVVSELAAQGIKTYVIGLPGSEIFSTVLDRLAIAGQTARDALPRFFPASNSDELAASLRAIGVSIVASCDVTLAAAPPDRGLVNVYLDQDVVPLDAADGWAWTTDASIELRGEACAQLERGDVVQVQVVAGCPTVVK
jgi:hypothetical protein